MQISIQLQPFKLQLQAYCSQKGFFRGGSFKQQKKIAQKKVLKQKKVRNKRKRAQIKSKIRNKLFKIF